MAALQLLSTTASHAAVFHSRTRAIVDSLSASRPLAPPSSAAVSSSSSDGDGGAGWRRRPTRWRRRAAAEDGGGGEAEFEVSEAAESVLRSDASRKMLDGLAEKALQDDEESRALLQDFAAAAQRVAKAVQDLDSIDRREKDLAQLMSRDAADATAASLVAEEEGKVRAAEEELKAAEIALITARAGGSLGTASGGKWETGGVDDDLERVESGKAAAISALAGTLAGLPFVFLSGGGGIGGGSWVSVGGVALSCALFGVTYRYVLRGDSGNVQLKLGAAAAFALVRGIGQLDAIQRYVGYPVTPGADEAVLAAFGVLEGLFSFGFSVLALDYCMREALLAPFQSRKR